MRTNKNNFVSVGTGPGQDRGVICETIDEEAKQQKMSVSLIAPTLNEIEAVKVVIPQINRDWIDEIIIVDGGSTDGTVDFCRQNGCTVYTQKKKGYGAAMCEAIQIAKGDLIIEFQPDGNSLPEKIPELIAKINEGYDLVVGSRYKDGAKSHDDDYLTAIGNRVFTRLVNLAFGSSYTDVLIGYRIFRRDAFKALDIDSMGLSWAIQLPIRFAKKGFKIAEIPADEPKRIGGVRKMRPFKHGTEFLMVLVKEMLSRN
ncbi:MAG TPA: glycosyltransferase family 2 protein [Blastocatellia bacterium]|nr:glycosyltransferase family 2 protein [Blastocatellia bacterium]